MATDRLNELMALGKGDGTDADSAAVAVGGSELVVEEADASTFAEASRGLEAIQANTAMLKTLQLRSLTWVGGHAQVKVLNRQIEELGDSTKSISISVAQALKAIDAGLNAELEENPTQRSRSTYKIRRNKQALFAKKFVERTQAFQDVQTHYKVKQEQTIRRQFRLVNPNATDAEVTAYLESDSEHGVFEDLILNSAGAQQSRVALTDVREKHREIQILERSIRDLHELFVDVSLLVESQGETLDQIDISVASATGFAAGGVNELRQANRYAAQARRKMCCLALVLLTLVSVTVLKTTCELWPTSADEQSGDEAKSPAPEGCTGVLGTAVFVTSNAPMLLFAAGVAFLCCGARVCSKREKHRPGAAVALPFTPARHYKTVVRAMQPRKYSASPSWRGRKSGRGTKARSEASSPYSGGGSSLPNPDSGENGSDGSRREAVFNTPMLMAPDATRA